MLGYGIVICWNNDDRAFIAEAPELPGCMVHGDDRETALRNIEDAMQIWVDTAREFGDPIPQSRGERPMFA